MTDWVSLGSRAWKNEELGLTHVVPEAGGYYRVRYRNRDGGESADTVNPYKTGPRSNWGSFVGKLPEEVRDKVGPALIELEDLVFAEALQGIKKPPPFQHDPTIADLWKQGEAEEVLWKAASIIVEGQELQKEALILSLISQALPRDKWITPVFTGTSREGKSFTMANIGYFFLGPYFLKYNSHSPLFMPYVTRNFGEDYYRHHVLYVDDLSNNPDRLGWVRILTDRTMGEATHGTVIKGEPVILNVNPPPLVWASTIDPPQDITIRKRFWNIPIDESDKQDGAVFRRQKQEDGVVKQVDHFSETIETAARLMEHIRRDKVDIYNQLGGAFSEPRQKGKDTYNILSGLTQSFTLLRRYQRPSIGSAILSTWEDVRDALTLWYMWEGVQDLPPERIYAFMGNFRRNEALSKAELMERTKLSHWTVYEYIRDAFRYGLLEPVDGKPPKWRIAGDPDVTIIRRTVEEKVNRGLAALDEDEVRGFLRELATILDVSLDVKDIVGRLMPPDRYLPSDTQIALTNLAKKNKVAQRQGRGLSTRAPDEAAEIPSEPESSVPPPPPLGVEDLDMSFAREEQPTEAGEKEVQSPQSDEEEPSDDEEDNVEVVTDKHGFQHLQWRGDDRLRRRKHG